MNAARLQAKARKPVCFARLDAAYERRRQAELFCSETVRRQPSPPRESPIEIAPEGPLERAGRRAIRRRQSQPAHHQAGASQHSWLDRR